jgi:hypothetical protein
MKRKTKIAYDISINKKCPNCIFRCSWSVVMRCEEHRKHFREHWEKQL